MKKCLVLGGEGLMGHMLVSYVNSLLDFEVYFTTRNKDNGIYFDVYKDVDKIEKIIKKIKPDLVVNCIGIINKLVNEKNKAMVVFINSYFPHKLADICKKNNSKLIQISTDCVFSGDEGKYTESSDLSPTDFYGRSKALGEVNEGYNLTIRTSLIGQEIKEPKTGLMEWFLAQKGKEVKGYTNVIWSGLTTLELAKQIIKMYEMGIIGLINIVSEPISKYDLLHWIKNVYGIDILIREDSDLKCDRSMKSIRNIKCSVPFHMQMMEELKEWGERNV